MRLTSTLYRVFGFSGGGGICNPNAGPSPIAVPAASCTAVIYWERSAGRILASSQTDQDEVCGGGDRGRCGRAVAHPLVA